MFHVKHSDDTQQAKSYLQSCADAWGVSLSSATATALVQHVRILLEANQRVNLTAIKDYDEAMRLHALDSVAVVPFIKAAPAGRVADLGSGGGFPGIPIALSTGRRVSLVESVKKKAAFLESVVAQLGLSASVQVHPVRAEEEAIVAPSAYAVVVARALTSLPSLVELASPLLEDGGFLIAMKGRAEDDELKRGRAAAALVGMKQADLHRYQLPDGGESRSIVVYRRSGQPKLSLPRNTGTAQKKPLA